MFSKFPIFKEKQNIMSQEKKSIILGLDVSKACVGVAVIESDGDNLPIVKEVTHIVPKIPSRFTGIEALILRKEIFEKDFLSKLVKNGITHCVIEAPAAPAQIKDANDEFVNLNHFVALIGEAVYKTLGIAPLFITSKEARKTVFPNLMAIRKFNKQGVMYGLEHYRECISKNRLTLFGEFPFDCDKKQIILDLVSELYPEIAWVCNAKGEVKKENYDACDALVCAMSYLIKENNQWTPDSFVIDDFEIVKTNEGKSVEIKYHVSIRKKRFSHRVEITREGA